MSRALLVLAVVVAAPLTAACTHTPPAPAGDVTIDPAAALVAAAGALDLVALQSRDDQVLCGLAIALAAGARAGAGALATGALPAVTVDLGVCGVAPLEPSCETAAAASYVGGIAAELAAEVDAPDGRVSWAGAGRCP